MTFARRRVLAVAALVSIVSYAPANSVSALGGPAEPLAPPATAEAKLESARQQYEASWVSQLGVPVEWTGDVTGCIPGAASDSGLQAFMHGYNYLRGLAGLPPTRADDGALAAESQELALMVKANSAINYSWPTSSRCFTEGGNLAANQSVMVLGHERPLDLLAQAFRNEGRFATHVLERRGMLLSHPSTVGIGLTDDSLVVRGYDSPADPQAKVPRFWSWPGRGYFPMPLEPGGRWSLHWEIPGLDFEHARVFVTLDGRPIPVDQKFVDDRYPPVSLVWDIPREHLKPGTYRVVVDGLKRPGATRPLRYRYSVSLFEPSP